MQMYPENIEELLKKKYAQEQVDIDHDALWTRVYPQIKKDKKRPFALWFLTAFLVGAMVSSLFYFNYADSDTTVSTDLKVAKEESIVLNQEGKEKFVKETEAKAQEVENDTHLETQHLKKSLTKTKVAAANIAPVSAQFKAELSNDVIPASEGARVSTLTTSNSGRAIEVFSIGEAVSRKEPVLVAKELVLEEPADKRLSSLSLVFPLALSPTKLGIDQRILAKMDVSKQFVEKIPKANGGVKEKKFSIDLLFGYGLTSQRLNLNNPIDVSILSARQSNEKALDAFSFSLLGNLELNTYLKLRSGLFYQMITDRSENIFRKSEIVDVNGDPTSFYLEGEELHITTTTNTRYNSYHTLGVPVQLVAYKSMGAFDIELGAGIGLAHNTLNKGYIQSVEGLEYDLKLDEENLFQNKLQSNLLMDLGAIYRFNDCIGWNTNVQYSYGLSGYNSGENPISQKYNVIKINTGLRYQF